MKHQRLFTLALIFALATLLAACGGGNATPTAAYKSLYGAIKNKDVAALKKVIAKKELDEMESEAKKDNKQLDDVLKALIDAAKLPKSDESKDEKIDGDKATLQVKNDKDEWETIRFVKEADGWKISG